MFTVRRFDFAGATRFLAACAFIAVTGCSSEGLQSVAMPHPAGLPLPSLSTSERNWGAPRKIYITNAGNNTLTTYKYDGTPTTPTITGSLNEPQGVAVDANGKIYVANYGSDLVTAYTRYGKRTSLTIYLRHPQSITVDVNGKIYVSAENSVYTYNHDGSHTTPTIHLGGYRDTVYVEGLAVDANGKIYVTYSYQQCPGSGARCEYWGGLVTYNPDGSPTTPSISFGPARHFKKVAVTDVAVSVSGKIYIAWPYLHALRAYKPDGSQTKPTIGGLSMPHGVAIDANGKIYIVDAGNNMLTAYTPNGSPTTPTIAGLDSPAGVALH